MPVPVLWDVVVCLGSPYLTEFIFLAYPPSILPAIAVRGSSVVS